MCITLDVQTSLKTFKDWKALQQEVATATGRNGLRLRAAVPASNAAPVHLVIVSYVEECGCELVEIGSAPSDDEWRFLPAVYAQLPATLMAIRKRCSGPVRFAPCWLGSDPDEPAAVRIRLRQLVALCKGQALPAKTVFTIE